MTCGLSRARRKDESVLGVLGEVFGSLMRILGGGGVVRMLLRAEPLRCEQRSTGILESVEDYVGAVDGTPTTIAFLDGKDVGFLTLLRHNPHLAEIYVMGALPEHHHQGIGRKLVEHAENSLASDAVEFLQVKTLSASHSDAGYQKTRAFYFACGFRPLQEFRELWGPGNPWLQMVKCVARAR